MVIKFNHSKDAQGSQRTAATVTAAVVTLIILLASLVAMSIYLAFEIKFCGKDSKHESSDLHVGVFPIITEELFGTYEGKDIFRYTLSNKNGMEVKILNYGGIITNIYAHDKNNNLEDIVLGFDTFEEYKNNTPYFGALIGRYANRIAGGHFTLDGVIYNLTKNDGPNALHGGLRGFDKRVWTATIAGPKLILSYVSADGEEHYPGQVNVTVTYELTDRNELILTYRARTSKPTVINLTNHAYFNLAKQSAGTIADHVIRLEADYYLPVDITQIPIGIVVILNSLLPAECHWTTKEILVT